MGDFLVTGRTSLLALRPSWEPLQGRERMGLSCDCPLHPLDALDRAWVWFDNPPDGGDPGPGATVTVHHLEEGEGFQHLTLLPADGPQDGPLALSHWRGWVVDGVLMEAFITGVAW